MRRAIGAHQSAAVGCSRSLGGTVALRLLAECNHPCRSCSRIAQILRRFQLLDKPEHTLRRFTTRPVYRTPSPKLLIQPDLRNARALLSRGDHAVPSHRRADLSQAGNADEPSSLVVLEHPAGRIDRDVDEHLTDGSGWEVAGQNVPSPFNEVPDDALAAAIDGRLRGVEALYGEEPIAPVPRAEGARLLTRPARRRYRSGRLWTGRASREHTREEAYSADVVDARSDERHTRAVRDNHGVLPNAQEKAAGPSMLRPVTLLQEFRPSSAQLPRSPDSFTGYVRLQTRYDGLCCGHYGFIEPPDRDASQ